MNLKKFFLFIFPVLIFCSLLLSGCETKKSELHSASPDGTVHITVSGTKTFMEPWDLVIEIKANEKSNKMETQLYGDELNNSNVVFNWTDNSTCIIKLVHQDGETRMIEIAI